MVRLYCAVADCQNGYRKAKQNNLKISFHRFPRDNRRKDWIRRCKRADDFNPDNSIICSSHFDENDFEVDIRSQSMGLPGRQILKKMAIPQHNIPGLSSKNASKRTNRDLDDVNKNQLSRSCRMKKRCEEQNKEKLLSSILDPPTENVKSDPAISVPVGLPIDQPMDIPSPNYHELYLSECKKNEELQRKMELMQEEQKKYAGIAQKCIDHLLLLL